MNSKVAALKFHKEWKDALTTKRAKPSTDETSKAKENTASCSCISDPYASLPNELRPRPESNKARLRQVNCPACGQAYRTNRKTDICITCEKAHNRD